MRIRDNKGFTLIELLIVVAIIGIIAAIAIPGLLRARMSGNEASAIGSLRAIGSSQQAYASSCGNGFYGLDLTVLGDPPTTGAGAAFISPDLGEVTTPVKSGYTITMVGTAPTGSGTPPPSCNAGSIATGYLANADPLTPGSSGVRYFGTNTSGTIYQDPAGAVVFGGDTGPATAPATPIQ